jgi:hypothetical protein
MADFKTGDIVTFAPTERLYVVMKTEDDGSFWVAQKDEYDDAKGSCPGIEIYRESLADRQKNYVNYAPTPKPTFEVGKKYRWQGVSSDGVYYEVIDVKVDPSGKKAFITHRYDDNQFRKMSFLYPPSFADMVEV